MLGGAIWGPLEQLVRLIDESKEKFSPSEEEHFFHGPKVGHKV